MFVLWEIWIDGDIEYINLLMVCVGVVGWLKGNFFMVDFDMVCVVFE